MSELQLCLGTPLCECLFFSIRAVALTRLTSRLLSLVLVLPCDGRRGRRCVCAYRRAMSSCAARVGEFPSLFLWCFSVNSLSTAPGDVHRACAHVGLVRAVDRMGSMRYATRTQRRAAFVGVANACIGAVLRRCLPACVNLSRARGRVGPCYPCTRPCPCLRLSRCVFSLFVSSSSGGVH